MSDYRVAPPKTNPIGALVVVIGAAILIWYFFMGGLERQAQGTMGDIEKQVANDAVTQYGIAKRSGTPMDACVHAGLVAASFLQAKDEASYQQWKSIEKTDCRSAGMSP
jgi:hypothetical protein